MFLLCKTDDETCCSKSITVQHHHWLVRTVLVIKPWVTLSRVFFQKQANLFHLFLKQLRVKPSIYLVAIKAVKQQSGASDAQSFRQCLSGGVGGLNWLSGNWLPGKWAWISAEVLSSVHQPLQMRAISAETDSISQNEYLHFCVLRLLLVCAPLHCTLHLFHPTSTPPWYITPVLLFHFRSIPSWLFMSLLFCPSSSSACLPKTSTLAVLV